MSRDDDWGDELAELLAAERAVEPPAGSAERVRARVAASVAVGLPPDPGGASGPLDPGAGLGSAASSGGAAGGGLGAAGASAGGASVSVAVSTTGGGLIAAVLGAATAAAVGGWLLLTPTEPDEKPIAAPAPAAIAPAATTPPPPRSAATPTATPEPEPQTETATATVTRSPSESVQAPVARPEPVAEAPPARKPRRPLMPTRRAPPKRGESAPESPVAEPPAAPAPGAAPTAAPPAVDDALRRELALLTEAREALAAQAPARALRALDTHERQYPEGRFGQERALLTIRALLDAGRLDDARREAARFRTRHPRSLHRPSIDRMLPPNDESAATP